MLKKYRIEIDNLLGLKLIFNYYCQYFNDYNNRNINCITMAWVDWSIGEFIERVIGRRHERVIKPGLIEVWSISGLVPGKL